MSQLPRGPARHASTLTRNLIRDVSTHLSHTKAVVVHVCKVNNQPKMKNYLIRAVHKIAISSSNLLCLHREDSKAGVTM